MWSDDNSILFLSDDPRITRDNSVRCENYPEKICTEELTFIGSGFYSRDCAGKVGLSLSLIMSVFIYAPFSNECVKNVLN